MPRLTIATTAAAHPMGAQAYESAIRSRAQAALDATGPGWVLRDITARSLRSSLSGNRRLPMRWLVNASLAQRRLIGRMLYPTSAVVHRMDLILPPPAGPDIATLHDMVAWDFPDESPPIRAATTELRRADAVICVSKFTAQTAHERLALKNTVVVPNGVSSEYFVAEPLSEDQLQRFSLRRPYVLYAGGSAARKNLPGLARAWQSLADSHPEWTLALSGPLNDHRTRLFAGLPRVTHLGRVPDSVMPGLMAGADAAVVPSLYEGFGLPALEAMAAQVPLVSSNRSSLPEVVADGGTLVDPTPEGLAEGLNFVMSGSAEVAKIAQVGVTRAKHFTWERSAHAHAEVWATLG